MDWLLAVQTVKQTPVTKSSAAQASSVCCGASASSAMLKPPMPASSAFQLARPSAAVSRAPASAPSPKQAERIAERLRTGSQRVRGEDRHEDVEVEADRADDGRDQEHRADARRAAGVRQPFADAVERGSACVLGPRDPEELALPHQQQAREHGEEADGVEREAGRDADDRDQHARRRRARRRAMR